MAIGVQRIAAFSAGRHGGNPAGVVISDRIPERTTMQEVAQAVGFSETVFAAPDGDGWRVRYFSPEAEIPFCGHATIALAAALAMQSEDQEFLLHLPAGSIKTEGRRLSPSTGEAAFDSPASSHRPVGAVDLRLALDMFGLHASDLDPELAPAVINAGADHLFLPLKSRATLAAMAYNLSWGRTLMRDKGWVTVLLAHAETEKIFHARNAFAYGGVYEDPATGAAAAALAGYLRANGRPQGTSIEIFQGDDMGMPCRLRAELPRDIGAGVRVSGTVRWM